MSPVQAVKEGALAVIQNPWIISIGLMFQGGLIVSIIAGAVYVGNLNRLVLRNTTDIAAHGTEKPHSDAEARLRVLESNISQIKTDVHALRGLHTDIITLKYTLDNWRKKTD